MDKLISSLQLTKQAADISLESFEIFSNVDIDREHCRHASFIQVLLCKYIGGSDAIINDPDVMGDNDIPLYNNMIAVRR